MKALKVETQWPRDTLSNYLQVWGLDTVQYSTVQVKVETPCLHKGHTLDTIGATALLHRNTALLWA
jgi:hypothetical protein